MGNVIDLRASRGFRTQPAQDASSCDWQGCGFGSVFEASEVVVTRRGQRCIAALEPGDDVMCRTGFVPLRQVRSVAPRGVHMMFPEFGLTHGKSFAGDSRQLLFVCRTEVETDLGHPRGALLRLSDLEIFAASMETPEPGFCLQFDQPEIVLTDWGGRASALQAGGLPVLSEAEALFVFAKQRLKHG